MKYFQEDICNIISKKYKDRIHAVKMHIQVIIRRESKKTDEYFHISWTV